TLPRTKVGKVRTRTGPTLSRPDVSLEVVNHVVGDPRREPLKVRRRTHLLNEVILNVVRPTLHRGSDIRAESRVNAGHVRYSGTNLRGVNRYPGHRPHPWHSSARH